MNINIEKWLLPIACFLLLVLALIITILFLVNRKMHKMERLLKKEKSVLHVNLKLLNVHSKITTLLNSTNDFQLVIDDVLQELIDLYEMDRISIYRVVDNDKVDIKKISSVGKSNNSLEYHTYIKFERIVREAMKKGIFIIENTEALLEEEKELFQTLKISSMVILVLQLGGNKLGPVLFIKQTPYKWELKIIQELTIFCRILSNAWERYLQMNQRIEVEKENMKNITLLEKASKLSTVCIIASGLTHEINQPLNALRVTVDSIKYWQKNNGGAIPEFISNKVDTLSKGVLRIDEIVKYMRNYWVGNNKPVTISKMALNAVIKSTYEIFNTKIKEKDIHLIINYLPEDVMIDANKIQLEQIIINLVKNSIQAFDKSKKKEKTISITLKIEDLFVAITVSDNAIGIDSSIGEKVFDPFYSTKLDEDDGSGLGLALVKSFVNGMKGSIHYFNNSMGGVDFIIKFRIKN